MSSMLQSVIPITRTGKSSTVRTPFSVFYAKSMFSNSFKKNIVEPSSHVRFNVHGS